MNSALSLLATAVMTLALALPANAEHQSPPPPSPPKPFTLAELENVQLPNGLTITFARAY